MLVSVAKLLRQAREEGYALGAFNTANLETSRAIFEAAAELRSPVILQMTEKTFEYAGGRAMYFLVKQLGDFYFADIPFGIHLDHGRNLSVVREALAIGFKSVMMDASTLDYATNLEATKMIVHEAHAKGAEVQAELGNVPYTSEIPDPTSLDWSQYMTNPQQVQEFVEGTGTDVLAIAIGNAHGAFPERPEPDYERLEHIRKLVEVPLVMHGASDWDEERVTKVIERGVSCFNVDTATRTAFVAALQETLREHPEEKDIRKVLRPAKEAFREAVKQKMLLFRSSHKI